MWSRVSGRAFSIKVQVFAWIFWNEKIMWLKRT
jgi:hypothetical protein